VTLRSSASRNACTLLSLRPAAAGRRAPALLFAVVRFAVVRFRAPLLRVDFEPPDLVAIASS
jgi:hypothetical protein